MEPDLKWAIGIAVGVAGTVVTVTATAFWRVLNRIDGVRQSTESEHAILHERINRVRDETVNKSDFERDYQRLREDIREVRTEQQKSAETLSVALNSLSARLDTLIARVPNTKSDRE